MSNDIIVNGDFANWTADNPDDWAVVGESGVDPMVTEVVEGARLYTSGGYLDIRQGVGWEAGEKWLIVISAIVTEGRLQVGNSGVIGFVGATGLHEFYVTYDGSDTTDLILKRNLTPMDIILTNVSMYKAGKSIGMGMGMNMAIR